MTPTWRKVCLEETTVDVGVGLGTGMCDSEGMMADVGVGLGAGMCDSYLEEGMMADVGLGAGMCDSYLEETTVDVGVGGRHV